MRHPLPVSTTAPMRLPRVLRESTSFLLLDQNIRIEGIFRVNARGTIVDILKEAYDRGQKFIVWKQGESVLSYSHWREGHGNTMIAEVELAEGYGVHPAAGLIKQWYGKLRDPIFPKSCYNQLEILFGDSRDTIEPSRLLDLISLNSPCSPINQTSRLILTMHLLPLLSKITDCHDWNHMDAYNLSVCITPTLLCGLDPIEDAKMGGIICYVLEALIKQWKLKLAACCGLEDWDFEQSLRLPEAVRDREDPLEEIRINSSSREAQIEGITLIDNDGSDVENDETFRPILPPRPPTSQIIAEASDHARSVRRKPAPAISAPPRYSMALAENSSSLHDLPAYDNLIDDSIQESSERTLPT